MLITYNQYRFVLNFEREVNFELFPLFIVRSILGKELRSLCCISHQNQCDSCLYNQTCAYSWIFETILDKQNTSLPGRERGIHPWALQLIDSDEKRLDFILTLCGKANDYLQYIYAAFKRGEQKGIGKDRIPYIVEGPFCKGENLISDDGNYVASVPPEVFELNEDCNTTADVRCKVNLVTPLRITKDGKNCKRLEAGQFFPCINRRIRALVSLYGESSGEKPYTFSEITLSDIQLHYEKMNRWSARQKTVQNLGGIQGSFILDGQISAFEESLLNAAILFGAGKLTNFGLGQVLIEKI